MSATVIPTSVIALFCEDIREEKSGGYTLVGIFPDNINLQPAPGTPPIGQTPVMPKMCIYMRLHMDARAPRQPTHAKLTMPDGVVHDLNVLDEATIAKSQADAVQQDNPIAGIFARVEIAPLVINKMGRMKVEVTVGKESYLAGALNFATVTSKTTA